MEQTNKNLRQPYDIFIKFRDSWVKIMIQQKHNTILSMILLSRLI